MILCFRQTWTLFILFWSHVIYKNEMRCVKIVYSGMVNKDSHISCINVLWFYLSFMLMLTYSWIQYWVGCQTCFGVHFGSPGHIWVFRVWRSSIVMLLSIMAKGSRLFMSRISLLYGDIGTVTDDVWVDLFSCELVEFSLSIGRQKADLLLNTSAMTMRVMIAKHIPTTAPVSTSIGWWK